MNKAFFGIIFSQWDKKKMWIDLFILDDTIKVIDDNNVSIIDSRLFVIYIDKKKKRKEKHSCRSSVSI